MSIRKVNSERCLLVDHDRPEENPKSNNRTSNNEIRESMKLEPLWGERPSVAPDE